MKRLITIVFLLLSFFGYGQHHMMYVLPGQASGFASNAAYDEVSSIYLTVGAGNDAYVQFPTNTAVDDIIIAAFLSTTTVDHVTPTGWTKIANTSSSSASMTWFWKRATASDVSTGFTNSTSAGTYTYAIGTTFNGCVTTGSPIDASQLVSVASSSSITIPAMVGNDVVSGLSFFFHTIEDNPPFTSVTNYTQEYYVSETSGTDAIFGGYSYAVTDGTAPQSTVTVSATDYNAGLAIIFK